MKTCRILVLALALMVCPYFLCSGAVAASSESDPTVRLTTSLGDILVRLDARKAPISTANFVQYVKAGFYNGTVFHRVIKNFMIQGGGLTAHLKPQKGIRAPIRNEADNGLRNRKYTIAMARTSDPHSATSQFFINVKDNPFLDFKSQSPQGWGYTVFGRVIRGQNVVEKIAAVPTGRQDFYEDVPQDAVVITKAEIVE